MADILITLFYISIGGIIGAETRFWATGKLKHFQPLPYGTLFVNVSGSFGLGFFLIFAKTIPLQAEIVSMIGTGFFGCYTTMSSFTIETLTLQEQSRKLAILNLTLMLTAVFIGALVGQLIARVIS